MNTLWTFSVLEIWYCFVTATFCWEPLDTEAALLPVYYLCITCGYPLNQYLYSVYNVWSVNVEIWLPYSEIVSASVSVERVYLYGLMVANNLVLREKRALLTTI